MKPENKCGGAAVSSEFLKETVLVREMRKHFHYGSQYIKEVAEVTREGASSTFLLDISIQQKMNVCMVPFFLIGWRNLLMCTFVQGWRMKRLVVFAVYIYIRIGQKCTLSNLYICFHYESYIDKPRTWWRLSREGRYTLFRWSFGYTDWIKSTTRHKRWKLISPHVNRPPITCNNTSKKDWNCPRLRRAEHLSPQHPTLFDIIWLSLSNSCHIKP